jgi:hypothetical protein
LPPNGGVQVFDFEKVRKAARDEALAKSLDMLTDKQKSEWKKLVGEPFKYPLTTGSSGAVFSTGAIGIPGGFGGGFKVVPAPVLPNAVPPDKPK